jgi:hypothetical protein
MEWVKAFHGKTLTKEQHEKALHELDVWYKSVVPA